MKHSDFNEKESVYFISKWVIILAIVITSSVGFTLGFLVGKSVQSPTYQPQIIPQGGDSLQQDVLSQENISSPPSLEQTQDTSGSSSLQSQQDVNLTETKTNELNQTKQKVQSMKPEEKQQKNTNQQTNKAPSNKAEQETTKLVRYTVQTGAFKNPTEAESLKKILEKKGYKPYVVLSETKNNEKIYKVRVGEFNTRKEAEILSLRIKKSDGLNTFVTFK
ncbi:MAG: SPOR domain-containing protein [Nitrospirae bacterium]|nr:SPOR domain-containing protein [Nitrospirota bacterium]